MQLDVLGGAAMERLHRAPPPKLLLDRRTEQLAVGPQRAPELGVVGEVREEELDQVLRRLEAGGHELEHDVEDE